MNTKTRTIAVHGTTLTRPSDGHQPASFDTSQFCCNGLSAESFTRPFHRLAPEVQYLRVPYLNGFTQMYFNPVAYHSKF